MMELTPAQAEAYVKHRTRPELEATARELELDAVDTGTKAELGARILYAQAERDGLTYTDGAGDRVAMLGELDEDLGDLAEPELTPPAPADRAGEWTDLGTATDVTGELAVLPLTSAIRGVRGAVVANLPNPGPYISNIVGELEEQVRRELGLGSRADFILIAVGEGELERALELVSYVLTPAAPAT